MDILRRFLIGMLIFGITIPAMAMNPVNKDLEAQEWDKEYAEKCEMLDLDDARDNQIRLELQVSNAAFYGRIDEIQRLFDKGVNINFVWTRDVPVILASKRGHIDTVKFLLKLGVTVNAPDWLGATALNAAALAGNIEIVAFLLDKGADINSADSEDFETPLHTAVARNDVPLAELLIKRGANINAGNYDEEVNYFQNLNIGSPLHIAIREGHLVMAALLLASRCRENQLNELIISAMV